MTIAPVRQSVHTKAPPAKAFDIFTGQMGLWWPKGRTVGPPPHVRIVLEPRAEGRWYEIDAAGRETVWGKVLAWEPPGRLLACWQLNARFEYDPDLVTEIELTFAPAPDGGTDVTLEHRNLERFGETAPKIAASVADGWATMLPLFAALADQTETV